MIHIGSRSYALTKYTTKKSLYLLPSRAKLLCQIRRELNNSSTHSSPVKLAYASYESAVGKSSQKEEPTPVIIIHGLFGSKNNWNSLSKAIHQRTGRKVIAVDARNHGDSPHAQESSYADMVEDVTLLVKDLGIPRAVMVGHSMGARVMMYLALERPDLVDKLVSVDMSPVTSSPSLISMISLFEAMRNVTVEENVSLSKARKMTDQQLSASISSPAVRQFLLTNLVEAEPGKYKWRVNLPVLEKNFISHIAKFPTMGKSFEGPTLFIGGAKSDYIGTDDHTKIRSQFPRARIEYIPGAGHWVHSEKPKEFLDLITSFINETD